MLATFHATVPGFAAFTELYANDPFFGRIWLDIETRTRTDFVCQDSYLFRGDKLCVPQGSWCL